MSDNNRNEPTIEQDLTVDQFLDRISKPLALNSKYVLTEQLLKKIASFKEFDNKILRQINSLTLRSQLIRFFKKIKKPSFFSSIGIIAKDMSLAGQINNRAKKIFSRCMKRNKHGKQFTGMLAGELVSPVNNDDQFVIDKVFSLIYSLPQTDPVRKINSTYIHNTLLSTRILHKIKSSGLNKESIETNLRLHKERFMREGMRSVFLNLVYSDRSLSAFGDLIKAVIASFDRGEEELHPTDASNLQKSVAELSFCKTADEFISRAESILNDPSGGGYIQEVSQKFNLVLQRPIISIYKLLKFPLNRQLLIDWFHKSSFPLKSGRNFEKRLEKIKRDEDLLAKKTDIPGTYEGLSSLIYDMRLNFTAKYKLLIQTAQKDPRWKKPVIRTLTNIKDVQYGKIERGFLNKILDKLSASFSMSEIFDILDTFEAKINKAVNGQKDKLASHLTGKLERLSKAHERSIPVLKDFIKKEKMVPHKTLFEIDSEINPDHDPAAALPIYNSLIAYYLTMNFRIFINFMRSFFKGIEHSDAVVLRNRLSVYTKEEIFDFIKHYACESDHVTNQLAKYTLWGNQEREIRKNILAKLFHDENAAATMQRGRYTFKAVKRARSYFFSIHDQEGNRKFRRAIDNINSYPDFINAFEKHRLDTLINLGADDIKRMYQASHLAYLNELLQYVENMHRLFTEGLSRQPSKSIREKIMTSENPQDEAASLISMGEKEIAFREDLLEALEKEEEELIFKHQNIIDRIRHETRSHKLKLQYVQSLINYVRKLLANPLSGKEVAIEQVKEYLLTHTAPQNKAWLTTLKQQFDAKEKKPERGSKAEILDIIKCGDKIIVFDDNASLLPSPYTIELSEAANQVRETAEKREIDDIRPVIDEEITSREKYLTTITGSSGDGIFNYIYNMEFTEQARIISILRTVSSRLADELDSIEQINKLQSETRKAVDEFSEKLQQNPSVSQQKKLIQQQLESIDEADKKSQFLFALLQDAADNEELADTVTDLIKQLPGKGAGVVSSLIDVLNKNSDLAVREAVLDEFAEHVKQTDYPLYKEIEPAFSAQRTITQKASQQKKATITSIWQALNGKSTEDQLSLLRHYLEKPEYQHLSGFIQNIIDNLTAPEPVIALRKLSQSDSIEKRAFLRYYPGIAKEITEKPEVKALLEKMSIEVEAFEKMLESKKGGMLTSETLQNIIQKAKTPEGIVDDISFSVNSQGKDAAVEALVARGFSEDEIEDYVSTDTVLANAGKDVHEYELIIKTMNSTPGRSAKLEYLESYKNEHPECEYMYELDILRQMVQSGNKRPIGSILEMKVPDSKKISILEKLPASKLGESISMSAVSLAIEKIKNGDISSAVSIKSEQPEELPEPDGTEREITASVVEACKQGETVKAREILQTALAADASFTRNPEIKHRMLSNIKGAMHTGEEENNSGSEGGIGGFIDSQISETGKIIENQKLKEEGRHFDKLGEAIEGLEDFTDTSELIGSHGMEDEKITDITLFFEKGLQNGDFIYVRSFHSVFPAGKLAGYVDSLNEKQKKREMIKPVIINLIQEALNAAGHFPDKTNQLLGVESDEERNALKQKVHDLAKAQSTSRSKKTLEPARGKGKKTEAPESGGQKRQPQSKKSAASEKHGSKGKKNKQTSKERSRGTGKAGETPSRKKGNPANAGQLKKFIKGSFAPVINKYVSSMFSTKDDFAVHADGNRSYYDKSSVTHFIEMVLKSDINRKSHMDLLQSFKNDPDLKAMLMSELFIVRKMKNGKSCYFPKALKNGKEIRK